jgi:hypothetical protein
MREAHEDFNRMVILNSNSAACTLCKLTEWTQNLNVLGVTYVTSEKKTAYGEFLSVFIFELRNDSIWRQIVILSFLANSISVETAI